MQRRAKDECMKPYTSAEEINKDISEWLSITKWQSQAKEKEMLLRNRLAKHIFANKLTAAGDLPEGTAKNTFASGALQFNAKVVGKMNYKILEETEALTLAQLGEAGTNLVKRKPELSLSAYKALTEEQKRIADGMIVVTPGAPTLEIEILPQ